MTRQQRHLHLLLWLGLAPVLAGIVYLAVQAYPANMAQPSPNDPDMLTRPAGLAAFALLTLTLLIGPAARLSARLEPLIRGRRLLGLLAFICACAHIVFALFWDEAGFGLTRAPQTLVQPNPDYHAFAGFPFESLGIVVFAILCVLAATSFRLITRVLGARAWKAVHMTVYFAYILLVTHIALGVVQLGKAFTYLPLVAISASIVASLHILTGVASLRRPHRLSPDGWILVSRTQDMTQEHAISIKPPKGAHIVIFRDADKVWALAHNCPHQGGPLSRATLSDGVITCPCHGFKYDVSTGRAQTKRLRPLATYRVKIVTGRIYVHPLANPLNTATVPGLIPPHTQAAVYG